MVACIFMILGWEHVRRYITSPNMKIMHAPPRPPSIQRGSRARCFFAHLQQRVQCSRSRSLFRARKMLGLRNLGNTCFVSSVLQCAVHTPLFIESLEKCRDRDHGKLKLIPGHGNAGACLLCDLLGIRL